MKNKKLTALFLKWYIETYLPPSQHLLWKKPVEAFLSLHIEQQFGSYQHFFGSLEIHIDTKALLYMHKDITWTEPTPPDTFTLYAWKLDGQYFYEKNTEEVKFFDTRSEAMLSALDKAEEVWEEKFEKKIK